jgi:arylsulfatase A-like enzyme
MNQKSILLVFLAFFMYGFPAVNAQGKLTKPNVIFILADDLGIGDIGVYGQQKIKTPHIDLLAKEGMKFNQFYSGTSVCAPSRSSLMTGQHTGHTPIRGNKSTQPEGQWPLPADAVTVAEILKGTGYATGCFGKWGLGYIETPGNPVKQGFDEFYGYNCQSLAHDYFPDHLWHNNTRIDLPNSPQDQQVYSARLIHDKARAFIENNKSKPFFLFLSYTLPHAALQLPNDDSLFTFYKKLFNEQPAAVAGGWVGKGYQPQAYPHAAYAAMVSRLDQYVGEVKQQLEQLGIDKNTLIFFASDNGVHQEGGNDPVFFNSSGGFRGIKRDLYEGGIRTPFIAYWPGKIKPGSQSQYIGAFWDMLPTLAQLAGAKPPSGVDGISFVRELQGRKQKQHDHLYWEFHEQGGKQAVRMGRWKAVRLKAMEENTSIELYDLDTDPAEKNDVAAAHPGIAAKMASIMQKEHTESTDFPFGRLTMDHRP